MHPRCARYGARFGGRRRARHHVRRREPVGAAQAAHARGHLGGQLLLKHTTPLKDHALVVAQWRQMGVRIELGKVGPRGRVGGEAVGGKPMKGDEQRAYRGRRGRELTAFVHEGEFQHVVGERGHDRMHARQHTLEKSDGGDWRELRERGDGARLADRACFGAHLLD